MLRQRDVAHDLAHNLDPGLGQEWFGWRVEELLVRCAENFRVANHGSLHDCGSVQVATRGDPGRVEVGVRRYHAGHDKRQSHSSAERGARPLAGVLVIELAGSEPQDGG